MSCILFRTNWAVKLVMDAHKITCGAKFHNFIPYRAYRTWFGSWRFSCANVTHKDLPQDFGYSPISKLQIFNCMLRDCKGFLPLPHISDVKALWRTRAYGWAFCFAKRPDRSWSTSNIPGLYKIKHDTVNRVHSQVVRRDSNRAKRDIKQRSQVIIKRNTVEHGIVNII